MALFFTIAAVVYLWAGIVYFGSRKPNYSHVRDTISELGEEGTSLTRPVGFGLFLPAGLLLFVAAALATDPAVRGLAGCIGTGYGVAAFFPCDVGSPLSGSVRQQIHNLGGAVEYLGGAYFLGQFSDESAFLGLGIPTVGTGVVLIGTVLLSVPGVPLRGLVQRVAEIVLFGSLVASAL